MIKHQPNGIILAMKSNESESLSILLFADSPWDSILTFALISLDVILHTIKLQWSTQLIFARTPPQYVPKQNRYTIQPKGPVIGNVVTHSLNELLAIWRLFLDSSQSHQTLQWRHNERDGISNHQPRDCLFNRLFKAQIKENIKAPRHWPSWGEFTGDRWIPRTKGQYHGKASIWWRHHEKLGTSETR